MANNVNGIFETLVVPASVAAAQTAKFSNAMLNYVFTNYSGEYGKIGQVMNINIPIVNEGDVADIGAGAIQLSDTNHTPTSITINQNPSVSKRIQSFDQFRTSFDLQQLYMEPMVESLLRKVNRAVANLANPAASTGFLSVNSSQSGGGTASFIRSDVGTAWATLAGQGCPMDPANAFFVTHHVPYGTMLSDTTNNWVQQYVVGQPAAEKLQQTARFMPQYNMSLDYDQTMPKTSTPKYIALAFHRYAIGLKPVNQYPADSGGYVREMTIFPRPNLPLRVQLWYDPAQQGYVMHMNTIYGLSVVRPEWGVQIVAG